MTAGPREVVDLVADVLAGLTETAPGRHYEPGADLATAPAVGIAPGYPWITFRTIGRPATIQWDVRILVGRWETGPALEVAEAAYIAAAVPLRRAGYDVQPCQPPQVANIANVPMLVVTFPITYQTRS
jgi:hypothetical protein